MTLKTLIKRSQELPEIFEIVLRTIWWAAGSEQPSPPPLRSPEVGELLSKIWDAACINNIGVPLSLFRSNATVRNFLKVPAHRSRPNKPFLGLSLLGRTFSVTVFWQLPNSMINQHVLKHCKWVKIESAHRRFLPTHTFPKIWKSQLRVQFSRKWWARAFLPIYIGFLFLSHLVALSRAAVKKNTETPLYPLNETLFRKKSFPEPIRIVCVWCLQNILLLERIFSFYQNLY